MVAEADRAGSTPISTVSTGFFTHGFYRADLMIDNKQPREAGKVR